MNLARLTLLAATFTLAASAADVTGNWKVVFLGPPENRPKTVGSIVLDLVADRSTVTGTAHAGSWPGDTPITEGRLDGDRISFTVLGSGAWKSSGPQGQASGYPRLRFTGTVNGKEMTLTLSWDSVMIYGNSENRPTVWEMHANKISD